MKLIGSTYCTNSTFRVNGTLVLQAEQASFLKKCYTHLELDYSKFHKMDVLSKMTLIGSETLLQKLSKEELEDNLALLFANTMASQRTDLRFIDSYANKGNPSPSLFVYTLPNILTGELAIKHKIYGESSFFVLPTFDADFFQTQIQFQFDKGAKYVLGGWVESEMNEKQESFVFLVENCTENTTIELSKLLNKYRNE